jgi:hypothetical protein
VTDIKAADLPVGSIIAAPRRHRVLMKVRTDGWNRIGDTDLDPDVIAQFELDEDARVLRHGYGNEGER